MALGYETIGSKVQGLMEHYVWCRENSAERTKLFYVITRGDAHVITYEEEVCDETDRYELPQPEEISFEWFFDKMCDADLVGVGICPEHGVQHDWYNGDWCPICDLPMHAYIVPQRRFDL